MHLFCRNVREEHIVYSVSELHSNNLDNPMCPNWMQLQPHVLQPLQQPSGQQHFISGEFQGAGDLFNGTGMGFDPGTFW